MREYQAENKLLFNILYPTIEFCEPWKLSDMEYVQEQFTADDERDGNGLYRWLEKNYDVKSPKMQIALRAQFDAFKLPITSSVHRFTKMWIDALSIWSKITGNNRGNVDIFDRLLDLDHHEQVVASRRCHVTLAAQDLR